MFMLLGVFIQPYMAEFRANRHWHFTGSWEWFLFSILIGIIIFPTIYKEGFNTRQPWFVLIGPSFTAGLGWESIFGTVVKAASI